MDWYYPVLAGALGPATASDRIDERWSEFVIEHRGVRCVSDRPWVTAAETAECALALVSLGRRRGRGDPARLGAAAPLRGRVVLDGRRVPRAVDVSAGGAVSYTAAAIVLAADALGGLSPAASLFVDGALPRGLDLDSEALEDRA